MKRMPARNSLLTVSALLALALLTLSCGGVITTVTPSPVDDLGTHVAATLTAAAAPGTPGSGTTPGPVSATLRLVYPKDGNLWLWSGSAGPRQLTSGGSDSSPKISSDGQWVAFLRSDELWVIQAGGSGERPLVPAAYLDALAGPDTRARISWFDFAPAGQWVYFNTHLVSADSGMDFPRYDLHRVDAASGAGPLQILAQGQGGDPYFSPDGQWLALSQAGRINAARLDGTDLRTVFTFPPVSTYSEWGYLPELVWMNTSTAFYVIIPAPAILDNPNDPARWYYVPLQGSPAQLAEFTTAPVWISFPRLSPDGTRAAIIRTPSSGAFELHLIDASNADQLALTHTGSLLGVGPWSPDGRYYIYWLDDVRDVYYAAPGEPAQPVSDIGPADFIAWVDASTVLFKAGPGLRLRRLGTPSLLLDTSITGFQLDFVP